MIEITRVCVLLGVAGLVACGGPARDDGETRVEKTEAELSPGNAFGTVQVMNSADWIFCTGTPLSDRWVLTDQTCVDAPNISLKLVTLNGTAGVTDVFFDPDSTAALVRSDQLLFNAAGMQYENPLYLGSAADLNSNLVTVPSYTTGLQAASGQLQVTTSTSAPNYFSSGSFQGSVVAGSGPQTIGAPALVNIDGVWRVAGIFVGFFNGNLFTSVDVFRDWAEGIMGSAATVFDRPNFGYGSINNVEQALLPGGPLSGAYDLPQLLIGNDAVTSLTVPNGWMVDLYNDAGFGRFLQSVSSNTPQLPANVDDQTSSAKLRGGVVLYQDAFQQRPVATLRGAGKYPLGAQINNVVSSLTVPMGWRVQLFDNPDFTGTNAVFNEGTYSTVGSALNDAASSVIVEEPVEVFVHNNYQGRVGRLLPGCYDVYQMGVPDNSISSVFVPPGMTAVLYSDRFSGTAISLIASNSSLPAFNDQTSSVCVYRN